MFIKEIIPLEDGWAVAGKYQITSQEVEAGWVQLR
jgi:hypothetical protein